MEPTDPVAFVRYYNAWRVGGDMDMPDPSKITRALMELCDKVEHLERELEQERRSPYIDSDESPVEVLAAIYDALDGITDDPANGYNFGTLVSRVKAAVQDAKHCEQERQDRKQADLDTIRALGERNDARKALLLAAEWGIAADGYSAEVAGAIRAWVIGGYKGEPPTAPDYYPKRKYEAVNPP